MYIPTNMYARLDQVFAGCVIQAHNCSSQKVVALGSKFDQGQSRLVLIILFKIPIIIKFYISKLNKHVVYVNDISDKPVFYLDKIL